MAEISLAGIDKTYPNGFCAVKDLHLKIADGEFVVLVGPSGCGKSTTLRMIAGLEETTGGTIQIGGRVVNEVHPKDRDIAMVFQNYALYPHMSVYKNMAFALKLRRVPRDEIDTRVRRAAETLGISELLDRKPRHLSGGQRQRVALGRAIVREPKAFLFDEPLSNLDAKLRVTMRAELKSLHRRLRTTSVYVTHDQEEAMTLGDRIVVMAGGIVQQVGSPLDVYRRPVNRFVASFVGSPPMNFVDGTAQRADGSIRFIESGEDGATIRLPISAAPQLAEGAGTLAVLGLRPQALTETGAGSASMPVRVEIVEPLGDTMDVFGLTPGGASVVARVTARDGLKMGDTQTFTIEPEAAHLFELGEFGPNMAAGSAGQAVA